MTGLLILNVHTPPAVPECEDMNKHLVACIVMLLSCTQKKNTDFCPHRCVGLMMLMLLFEMWFVLPATKLQVLLLILEVFA